MAFIRTEVEVEVDVSEFDTEELMDELESRKVAIFNTQLIQNLHDAYILNKTSEVDKLLKDLFYTVLGRIV